MIRLQDVSKVYDGETVAFRGLTLEIQKGEFFFLVGPSESGKVNGHKTAAAGGAGHQGSYLGGGKDITTLPSHKVPYLRLSVGTVFQDFKLRPSKTVSENVAFALDVLGRPGFCDRTAIQPGDSTGGFGGRGQPIPQAAFRW